MYKVCKCHPLTRFTLGYTGGRKVEGYFMIRATTGFLILVTALLLASCNDGSSTTLGTKDGGGSGASVANCSFPSNNESALSGDSLSLSWRDVELPPDPQAPIQAGIYQPIPTGSAVLLLQEVVRDASPQPDGVVVHFVGADANAFDLTILSADSSGNYAATLNHAVLADGTQVTAVAVNCTQVNL
jgi:hypothetical protein